MSLSESKKTGVFDDTTWVFINIISSEGTIRRQWVSFYADGIPWSEQSYDKGKRQGANVVYYENSKIRYKGFFRNDKRDSVWMFYDSTGKLLQTMMFKEDKEIPIVNK